AGRDGRQGQTAGVARYRYGDFDVTHGLGLRDVGRFNRVDVVSATGALCAGRYGVLHVGLLHDVVEGGVEVGQVGELAPCAVHLTQPCRVFVRVSDFAGHGTGCPSVQPVQLSDFLALLGQLGHLGHL